MCLISDNLTNWQLLDFVLVLLEWFLYFNYFISFIHYSNWEKRNLESDNLPKRILMETFVYGPICHIRGLLSGLKQSLTIESALEMMKNNFYFMLKAPFIHGILTFLSRLFGCVEKRLYKKAMVNFRVYGVGDWATGDCSVVLSSVSGGGAVGFGGLGKCSVGNIFLCGSCGGTAGGCGGAGGRGYWGVRFLFCGVLLLVLAWFLFRGVGGVGAEQWLFKVLRFSWYFLIS